MDINMLVMGGIMLVVLGIGEKYITLGAGALLIVLGLLGVGR